MHSERSELWLVDGFNLLHACLLTGRDRKDWWSAAAQAQVAKWLEPFARRHRVQIVFDASSAASERCTQANFAAELRYAACADDEIVRLIRADRNHSVRVVTADRSLADRCRGVGAKPMRPWEFREVVRALAE